MSSDVKQGMINLVAEAGKLFGVRHYRDYHFLLTLSDHVAHFGLEHHESNDSRLPERTLLGPGAAVAIGGLLAHEYAHSWNGKFRRPAGLSTPYYEEPEKTDLLWVYEGLTDFLGPMLAARSGLWTSEEYRDYLAGIAAALGPGRPGRTWRPLQDTATAEPYVNGRGGFFNWRRGTDYYEEGDLLWLDVATIIHDQTHGAKSIDDFCHLFHGGPNDGPAAEDLHLRRRGEGAEPGGAVRLGGLPAHEADVDLGRGADRRHRERGLEASSSPAGRRTTRGRRPIPADEYSIGLQLSRDGTVTDSIWGGPAFEAGLVPGMKVVGVNGRVYTRDLLEGAIAGSPKTAAADRAARGERRLLRHVLDRLPRRPALPAPRARRREAGLPGSADRGEMIGP